MPVSSKLARMVPSKRPTVGKFCTPEKPIAFSSARNGAHQHERVGAVDAGEDRRVADHRQHLDGHLLHDRVGVAVGEQPGGRAAAGHAVAAGVVDDDEVDAAGLLALGREAGAGAAADDRHARRRPCGGTWSRISARGMAGMAASGDLPVGGDEGVGELRVVDVEGQPARRGGRRSAAMPASSASKSAASACGSWKAPPGDVEGGDAALGDQEAHRSGAGVELRGDPGADLAALLRRGAHQRDVAGCGGRSWRSAIAVGDGLGRPEVDHVEGAAGADVGDAACGRRRRGGRGRR